MNFFAYIKGKFLRRRCKERERKNINNKQNCSKPNSTAKITHIQQRQPENNKQK